MINGASAVAASAIGNGLCHVQGMSATRNVSNGASRVSVLGDMCECSVRAASSWKTVLLQHLSWGRDLLHEHSISAGGVIDIESVMSALWDVFGGISAVSDPRYVTGGASTMVLVGNMIGASGEIRVSVLGRVNDSAGMVPKLWDVTL
jgi:hypothetical protein